MIGRIVIDETDADSQFPDNNIGFDTFRFVPPTSTSVPDSSPLVVFVGALVVCVALRGRLRKHFDI